MNFFMHRNNRHDRAPVPVPATESNTSTPEDKFSLLRSDREVTVREFTDSLPDFSNVMKPIDNRDGIIGGSVDGTQHKKYEDSNGDVWMEKTYPGERVHRAVVDELVSSVAEKLQLPSAMTAKVGRMDGKIKVFVKWEEAEGSLWDDLYEMHNDPERFVKMLSAEQLKQIAQEQVMDWLVANYDAHPGHFLKRPGGGFLCIDKTQAFKYLGDEGEELSTTFNPNGHINGRYNVTYFPTYNIVLPQIQRGNAAITLEEARQAALEVLDQVDQIDDREYMQMIQPYAKFRFSTVDSYEDKKRGMTQEKFMEHAMKRKREIKAKFNALYQSLEQGKSSVSLAA